MKPTFEADIIRLCKLFEKQTEGTHTPYLILLNDRTIQMAVYVGMTELDPVERFAQHVEGVKTGKGVVQDYGVRLIPDAYRHLSNCSEAESRRLEFEISEALKKGGFLVFGGH